MVGVEKSEHELTARKVSTESHSFTSDTDYGGIVNLLIVVKGVDLHVGRVRGEQVGLGEGEGVGAGGCGGGCR